MSILGEFIPKKVQFISIYTQFMLIYRRFFITYIPHTPQVNAPTPIFSSKTRIYPQNQKKNLKNPKFPPIFKISFIKNVNLRKLMVLNFDFQSDVL